METRRHHFLPYATEHKPVCFTYRLHVEGEKIRYINSLQKVKEIFQEANGHICVFRLSLFAEGKCSDLMMIVSGWKDGNSLCITHGDSELNEKDAFEIDAKRFGTYLERLQDGNAPSMLYEDEDGFFNMKSIEPFIFRRSVET